MNVTTRITQAPACEIIKLTDAEKDIYNGAGWKLARFTNGQLIEFFDPLDVDSIDNVAEQAKDAVLKACAWMTSRDGEFWLVLCSCYELCEPRRVDAKDASAIAHMLRIFGEQFANL